ncbi:hypothetical protein NEOLEDRAFT_701337 [Neolentinus lepideus HHB14362 ss-1]|uniref:Uncharacterized protein n=1 Tax=Neolentinus lepideus HHB14362 ss-1 TaxID=1314782 RepID=A0A165V497_9AGAM|nr:hypothetical protein NEOLEDRAFT_701337 [Neolentinus lepideus HHB14362 ss-1]
MMTEASGGPYPNIDPTNARPSCFGSLSRSRGTLSSLHLHELNTVALRRNCSFALPIALQIMSWEPSINVVQEALHNFLILRLLILLLSTSYALQSILRMLNVEYLGFGRCPSTVASPYTERASSLAAQYHRIVDNLPSMHGPTHTIGHAPETFDLRISGVEPCDDIWTKRCSPMDTSVRVTVLPN